MEGNDRILVVEEAGPVKDLDGLIERKGIVLSGGALPFVESRMVIDGSRKTPTE